MVRYHNSGTQKFDDVESDSVKTGDLVLDGNDILNSGDVVNFGTFSVPNDSNISFTQTSYSPIDTFSGFSDTVPSGFTPVVKFNAVISNDTVGETTRLRPRVFNPTFPVKSLSELEIDNTGTSVGFSTSGWVEVSNINRINNSNPLTGVSVEGEVSGGTGEIKRGSATMAVGGRL